MKIGMTGGTGFIGSYLLKHLKQNHAVRNLVRTAAQNEESLFCADYGNTATLAPFLRESDALIHLANSSRPRDALTSMIPDIENNLIKTLRLFEAYALARPDGHLIFFSSGGTLYRDTDAHLPFAETAAVNPTSSYANQKFFAENFLRALCVQHSMRATVLRVSNPYGVLLGTNRNQGLIGVATACALSGKPLNLFGKTDLIRDYIHLEDLSRAVDLIVKNTATPGFRVFNLGSGVGHSTQEVVELIRKMSPRGLNIQVKESVANEVAWNVLDITKLKLAYSWAPEYTLEQGLSAILR